MEDLQGYVEHIVFRNADNGYTVLNLISEEDEITCVGIFPVVTEGEILLLHGEYTSHPTYGEQFQMKSYETKAPEDVLSMERYLASGAIKGIGVALASRIVRRFKRTPSASWKKNRNGLRRSRGSASVWRWRFPVRW